MAKIKIYCKDKNCGCQSVRANKVPTAGFDEIAFIGVPEVDAKIADYTKLIYGGGGGNLALTPSQEAAISVLQKDNPGKKVKITRNNIASKGITAILDEIDDSPF